jgi:Bacterial regulatory proteins, luxR family
MIEVARGRLSKQIAFDSGIAEATVKMHRSRAMRKMNARSLPKLGRMIEKLKPALGKKQHSRAGISGLRVSNTVDRRCALPANKLLPRCHPPGCVVVPEHDLNYAPRTCSPGSRKTCSANQDLNISFVTASKPRFSATKP